MSEKKVVVYDSIQGTSDDADILESVSRMHLRPLKNYRPKLL